MSHGKSAVPANLNRRSDYIDALQEAALIAEKANAKIRKISTHNGRITFKFARASAD